VTRPGRLGEIPPNRNRQPFRLQEGWRFCRAGSAGACRIFGHVAVGDEPRSECLVRDVLRGHARGLDRLGEGLVNLGEDSHRDRRPLRAWWAADPPALLLAGWLASFPARRTTTSLRASSGASLRASLVANLLVGFLDDDRVGGIDSRNAF
jgi:hypothetical protein